MKFRGAAMLVAVVALVGCGSSNQGQPGTLAKVYAHAMAKMKNGRSELQKSLEAKKAVGSYRMKISLSMHPGSSLETDVQVSCPDRERFVSHIGDSTMEAVRIGSDAFTQQKDGQWTKHSVTQDAYPCGDKAGAPSPWAMMNEGRDMNTIIASMAGNPKAPITITPGVLTSVEGKACQEWMVGFSHPGSKDNGHGMMYTVCLDQDTRLPARVTLGNGGMTVTYLDWNKPFQISAPTDPTVQVADAKEHHDSH
ncbi:MAG: hypothetical protein H0X25_12680 [Acidobacteriales bacterium]|nr:hypothetical protein [Terriglobales bacterium]